MLGGYETCFGMSLDRKPSSWGEERSEFLFKSKFLGFVEAPVGVFNFFF